MSDTMTCTALLIVATLSALSASTARAANSEAVGANLQPGMRVVEVTEVAKFEDYAPDVEIRMTKGERARLQSYDQKTRGAYLTKFFDEGSCRLSLHPIPFPAAEGASVDITDAKVWKVKRKLPAAVVASPVACAGTVADVNVAACERPSYYNAPPYHYDGPNSIELVSSELPGVTLTISERPDDKQTSKIERCIAEFGFEVPTKSKSKIHEVKLHSKMD